MTEQYNGLSANISGNLPFQVSITSSTNANPVVVQTATPHGMTTGDKVHIVDHQTNVVINDTWIATVIDATHYSVPVAGVGVGAFGFSQSLALGPTYLMPTDGDNIDASSVNVAFEALGDRTSFLAAATGGYKVVAIFSNKYGAASQSAWSENFAVGVGGMVAASVTPQVFLVGNTQENDIMSITFSGTGVYTNSTSDTNPQMIGLMGAYSAPGGSPGSYNQIAGASAFVTYSGGSTAVAPITLSTLITVPSGNGGANDFHIQIGFRVFQSVSGQFTMLGEGSFSVVVYRPTGMVQ